MIGRITAEKCHLCKMNCPQEKLAKSCAEGRMYATQEVVRLQKELEVYKAISTPEECREAMEKQTAKKPTPINYEKYANLVDNAIFLRGAYWCPHCKHVVKSGTFCRDCGQKLDWSDEK